MKIKIFPPIKDYNIEYTHEWFYHKKCDAYLIYMAGGTFVCDHCGYEVLFTDLGLTAEPQTKRLITGEDIKSESHCEHCGAELPKGQSICHVCAKKVE